MNNLLSKLINKNTFFGVIYKNVAYVLFGALISSLPFAYARQVIDGQNIFPTEFLLNALFCSFVIGIILFQEKISEELYNDIKKPTGVTSSEGGFEFVTVIIWLSYWYGSLRMRRFVYVLLIQFLFVLGFHLLS